MFLDDFVLEPSENFKSVFLEMVFADFIDSNGAAQSFFLSDSNNFYIILKVF